MSRFSKDYKAEKIDHCNMYAEVEFINQKDHEGWFGYAEYYGIPLTERETELLSEDYDYVCEVNNLGK